MNVVLRELTKDNWKECAELQVREDQEVYVDTNLYCIAEASFEPQWRPFAAYHEETMVGMVVYGVVSDGTGVIHHLMIAGPHQRRGYGRAVLLETLERLRSVGCREVRLSYWPGNPAARLYESVGFEHTGEEWDGEPVMALRLKS